MNSDHGGLFRELEPPRGGAERFRRRIEESRDSLRASLGWALTGGIAVAALVIAAFVALRPHDQPEPQLTDVYAAPEFDRLLGRPLEPVATSVSIDDQPVAVSEVPTTRPGIRIYEIRSN
jgi:hypothetical protein